MLCWCDRLSFGDYSVILSLTAVSLTAVAIAAATVVLVVHIVYILWTILIMSLIF